MTRTLFERTWLRSFVHVSVTDDVWTRNNKTVSFNIHAQRHESAWSIGIVLWRIYALVGQTKRYKPASAGEG